MKQQNKFSHFTAIERTHLSFPAKFLLNNNLLKGKILDFGCGFGIDVKLLRQKGFNITGYDPYYFPQYPQDKFDTIICFYVLNVLFPKEQSNVLMEVAHLLKPGGKAYYAVRRDLKYEGFREHYIHKKPTYQCTVKLPFNSIKLDDYCEIYEYIHYNYKQHSVNDCAFCNPSKEISLITESAAAYAIFDRHPVSSHVLVIPKRHVINYFQLTFKEQYACLLMVKKVQEMLSKQFEEIDGFNIAMNSNYSGQNMIHSRIHIIPCYKGDPVSSKGTMR